MLFYDALTALTERSNMPPPHRDIAFVEGGYRHVARTGIFRVAAEDGRLVSLACAIVRGTQWFLSGFWTDPARRVQGIGGPLLHEVWEEGQRRGTRAHYVWASIDHAALASYMKLGMLPGSQLFTFAGPPSVPAVRSSLRTEPLTAERVAALDRDLVGMRRDDDHAYWLDGLGTRGVVVTEGSEVVGYCHRHRGFIGPVGWSRDDVAKDVLALAIRDAATDATEVQLTIPGMDHAALRFAFACGLRLIRTSHLLWNEPIGHLERYIPSGPLLF